MIPNKSSFKFEEITPITGVKPYVLRYWETEFPEISPVTSDSGQKIYSRKDLEIILKIKKLLFEDKITIPAAKAFVISQALEEEETEEHPAPPSIYSSIILNSIGSALNLIQEIKIKRNW
jgi:DNA-binding transcriptional MerR regulator